MGGGKINEEGIQYTSKRYGEKELKEKRKNRWKIGVKKSLEK